MDPLVPVLSIAAVSEPIDEFVSLVLSPHDARARVKKATKRMLFISFIFWCLIKP
jgi:hypothetical protein